MEREQHPKKDRKREEGMIGRILLEKTTDSACIVTPQTHTQTHLGH